MKQEEVISFYESVKQHYGAYHNHKEISAWGGLVLYLLFANAISDLKMPTECTTCAAIITTLFVGLFVSLVYLYISKQFFLKDIGGARVAAALAILSELISQKMTEAELSAYMFVQETGDENTQSSWVLPKRLLDRSN